jgi:hypothetical protein
MVDLYKIGLPSGKHLHSYGKSQFLMGKLTISRENLHFPMVFLWISYGSHGFTPLITGREAHARLAAMSLELQDHLPAVFPSHPIIWLLMVNNNLDKW